VPEDDPSDNAYPASYNDKIPSKRLPKLAKDLLSHGNKSTVYVPIILKIFRELYTQDAVSIDFSLDDIRRAADELNVRERTRNAGDVVYRMRARTKLPSEIVEAGFNILRQVGRGKYRLEKGANIIVNVEDEPEVNETIDITPLPVRRLLPEDISEIDEQGLLTIVSYCKLLDHFTGLTVYRLRNHVRKSVKGVGQAEVDAVDVGVALSEEEDPIVFPIEAKAREDAVNKVQIAAQVQFARQYFPAYEIRPLAIKIDDRGLVHFIEFTNEIEPNDLGIVRRSTYKINLSRKQREFIQLSRPRIVL
jgi:hypothetical protein